MWKRICKYFDLYVGTENPVNPGPPANLTNKLQETKDYCDHKIRKLHDKAMQALNNQDTVAHELNRELHDIYMTLKRIVEIIG